MIKAIPVDWRLADKIALLKTPQKHGNVHALIQARASSTRLPGKIYEQINGAPMLFHVIERALESQLIDDVIVVSPKALPELPEGIKEFVYNGPEEDVLSRYYQCVRKYPCDYIVRLTSDCPTLDPYLIDFVIDASRGAHYCSNVIKPTFPDGLDVEVLSCKMLEYLHGYAHEARHREHVTLMLRESLDLQRQFDLVSVESMIDWSGIKLSVDTAEDLTKVRQAVESMGL